MKFSQFMSSAAGRGLRVIAGIALIVIAAAVLFPAAQTVWGIVLIAVGAFFILVGAANVCVLGPIFGGSFNGRDHAKKD